MRKVLSTTKIDMYYDAFANEDRRRIVHIMLERKWVTITDLTNIMGYIQSRVNRHVQMLYNKGVIISNPYSRATVYSINSEAEEFVESQRPFFVGPVFEKDIKKYDELGDVLLVTEYTGKQTAPRKF